MSEHGFFKPAKSRLDIIRLALDHEGWCVCSGELALVPHPAFRAGYAGVVVKEAEVGRSFQLAFT